MDLGSHDFVRNARVPTLLKSLWYPTCTRTCDFDQPMKEKRGFSHSLSEGSESHELFDPPRSYSRVRSDAKSITNRSPPCRFKASNGRRARGLPRLRFTGSATIRCMGKRGIFPGSRLESRP